ncbi:MAG TPA: type II secretion system protein GspI [Thiotrichales bacterium]|nr:type II secretion system protein GspI [Thiotrichales bacterium]
MARQRFSLPAQQGFTLIEVMVALAIIAISLGALLNTSGTQASSATYLKQKSIAHWVALNELTDIQIKKTFPAVGDKKGNTDMAGHTWYWVRTTKKLEFKDAREVTFTVYADRDYQQNLTRLTGYAKRK